MAAFACESEQDFSEFDLRVPSARRRHGDPFPLPRLGRPKDSRELSRRVDVAIGAVNNLSSAVFDRRQLDPNLKLTHVQSWMMKDLFRLVSAYGPKPIGLSEDQALKDLGHGPNLYMQEAKNVVDLDSDEIKILSRCLKPTSARELGPPSVQAYIDHFATLVERPVQELEALRASGDLIEPHWDASLKRSRTKRFALYKRLLDSGLMTLRRRQKARMGLFAVGKKNGKPGNTQRLIVDCRQANALMRHPPSTRLATPAGLARLDFNLDSMMADGYSWEQLAGNTPSAETGDVGDCFYNFSLPGVSSWFSTGDSACRLELEEWGIFQSTIFNEDTGVDEPLEYGTQVYICFGGMPMGWAWALFMAQEIISYQCLVALEGSQEQLIRDKMVAPRLRPDCNPVGVYVDNVHIFSGISGEANASMEKVKQHFSNLGIPFEVDHVDGATSFNSLGLSFSFGSEVRVRATSQRTWRLWAATRCLLRRRRISGESMRLWLGHINYHFLLARPLLSSISACYAFARAHLGHRFPMWASVRREMRAVLGLLFVVEKNLSMPINPEVHVGDSSDRGFGLMARQETVERVRREMIHDERWRFIDRTDQLPLQELRGADLTGPPSHDDSSLSGTVPDAGLGSKTRYGKTLARKLDQDNRLQQRKVRLFGRPQQQEPEQVECFHIPPISDCWKDSTKWDLISSKSWENIDEHINVKEARVVLMAIRRLCRTTSNLGSRCLILSDSMVSILALSKGRSSAGSINKLCRRAAAYITCGSLDIHLRHIISEHNPADAPSRQHGPDIVKSISTAPLACATSGAVSDEREKSSRKGPLGADKAGQSGFLELFAGTGRLTECVKKAGLFAWPPFELAAGRCYDLLDDGVQKFIFGLLTAGLVWWVHLGTPCTAWSRARHNIKNFSKARAKEQIAVATALFTCRVIRECMKRGIMVTLENPRSSRLWEFAPIHDLLQDARIFLYYFDMCQYGEPHKKSTGILTNEEHFSKLQRRCQGGHVHQQLVGTVRVKHEGVWTYKNRTALAGAYPYKLCNFWAQLAVEIAPSNAFGRIGWRRRNDFLSALTEASLGGDKATFSTASSDFSTGGKRQASGAGRDPLREAARFIKEHPVVFGQFTGQDIEKLKAKFPAIPKGESNSGKGAKRVSQHTLSRYLSCVESFKRWARSRKKRVDASNLDTAVNLYITELYKQDMELSTASYLIYGLQLLECEVNKDDFLVMSKKGLAGWKKEAPGGMRLPVPEEFLWDAATLALEQDRSDIAVAIALQYDGYLRPSECLSLTSEQITGPQGKKYPHWSVIIAPSSMHLTTKTGKTDDSVLLGDLQHHAWLRDVLKFWMSRRKGPLFPNLTLNSYERWMRSANQQLGYSVECLKPHVIRHSAASNDRYHERRSLQDVGKRGRWEAKASVSRYEKHALLLTQWKHCAPARKNLVCRRSQAFPALLVKHLRTGGMSRS
eukprot:Skav230206  [mRNA]  locus=scaffold2443:266117:270539:+ [translate_table: standard]